MASTQAAIKPIEQVFAMTRGDDEKSYSKNSNVQKALVDTYAMPRLDEALQHATLPPAGKSIVVADLGCSSGPNSIHNVAHIVEVLRARSSDPRAVQAFFNDLPSNDFNTLFNHLSSEIKGNFFAAGVPGSFYGRLFPTSAVHVFFSSMSLHFISKIPDEIYDKSSPAFNANTLHIDDAPVAVEEVYKKQAAADLQNFLHARSAELAPGGLLFVIALGSGYSGSGSKRHLVEEDALHLCLLRILTTWKTLQSKGLVTKEQTAAVNMPWYFRTLDEVKEGIDSCSSEFRTHNIEMGKGKLFPDVESTVDRVAFSNNVTSIWRGVYGSFFEGILGKETAETFWVEYTQEIERTSLNQLLGFTNMFVIALIRK